MFTLTHYKFYSYCYETRQSKQTYRINTTNEFDAYEDAISILRTINKGYANLTDCNGDIVTEFEFDDIYSNDWELVYN